MGFPADWSKVLEATGAPCGWDLDKKSFRGNFSWNSTLRQDSIENPLSDRIPSKVHPKGAQGAKVSFSANWRKVLEATGTPCGWDLDGKVISG